MVRGKVGIVSPVCYGYTMKMLGKTNQPPCGSRCCGERGKAHTRTAKRRERQAWKKSIQTS